MALSDKQLSRLRRDWWHRFIGSTLLMYVGISVGPLIRWLDGKPISVRFYLCAALLMTALLYGVGQLAWNRVVGTKKGGT